MRRLAKDNKLFFGCPGLHHLKSSMLHHPQNTSQSIDMRPSFLFANLLINVLLNCLGCDNASWKSYIKWRHIYISSEVERDLPISAGVDSVHAMRRNSIGRAVTTHVVSSSLLKRLSDWNLKLSTYPQSSSFDARSGQYSCYFSIPSDASRP